MGAFTPFMFTMAMGTSVLLLLFAVGLLVVSIVSNWCVFTKAGEPGWKIFIPVYGSYVSYRIAGVSLYFWISLLLSAAVRLTDGPNGETTLLSSLFSLGASAVEVWMCINLARSFGRGIGFGAYRDESCTSFIGSSEAGYAIDYVEDSDPTDNKMEFIIRGHIDPMPKDAAYCLFSGIQSLCMQYQGEWVTMLDGMDIDLIVPLVGMGTHYDFQGRCGVNLNGVTLAVAENLTISPISVSMDLVIPDGAAYDAAFGQDGPWQMYVLMSDGSKIQTRFEKVGGVQDVFHDDAGRTFFRADHVRFELESPIDVAEIQNLVFTGDNSRIYEGEDRTGTLIQFDFGPWHFQNETYWNEVNYYWRKD